MLDKILPQQQTSNRVQAWTMSHKKQTWAVIDDNERIGLEYSRKQR